MSIVISKGSGTQIVPFSRDSEGNLYPVTPRGFSGTSSPPVTTADFDTRAELLANPISLDDVDSIITEGSYYGDTGEGGFQGYATPASYRVTNRANPYPDDFGTVLVPDNLLSAEKSFTLGTWDGQINTLAPGEQIVLRTATLEVRFGNGQTFTLPAGYLHGVTYNADDKGGGILRFLDAFGKIRLHFSQTPLGLPTEIIARYKTATSNLRLERTNIYNAAGVSTNTPEIEAQCFGIRPYDKGTIAITGDHNNGSPLNMGLRALQDLRARAIAQGLTNVHCKLKVAGGLPANRSYRRVTNWYPPGHSDGSGIKRTAAIGSVISGGALDGYVKVSDNITTSGIFHRVANDDTVEVRFSNDGSTVIDTETFVGSGGTARVQGRGDIYLPQAKATEFNHILHYGPENNRDLVVCEFTGGVRYGYLGQIEVYDGVELTSVGTEFRNIADADVIGTHPEVFPSSVACNVFVHLGEQHSVANPLHSPLNDGTYKDSATMFINNIKASDDPRFIACRNHIQAVTTGTMWTLSRGHSEARFTGIVIEPNIEGNKGNMEAEAGGDNQFEYDDWKLQYQDNSRWGGFQIAKNSPDWFPVGTELHLHDCAVNSTLGKCLLINNPDVNCYRTGACGFGGSIIDHGCYAPCGHAEHVTFWGFGGRGGYVISSEQIDELVVVGLAPNPMNRQTGSLGRRGQDVLEYRLAGNFPNQAAKTAAVLDGSFTGVRSEVSVRSDNTLALYPGSNITLRYANGDPVLGQKETNQLVRYAGAGTKLVGNDGSGGKAKVFGFTGRLTQNLDAGRYDAAWEECEIGNFRVILRDGESVPMLFRAPHLDGDSVIRDIDFEVQSGHTAATRTGEAIFEMLGKTTVTGYVTKIANITYAAGLTVARVFKMYFDRTYGIEITNSDLPDVLSSSSEGFMLYDPPGSDPLSRTTTETVNGQTVTFEDCNLFIPTAEYTGGNWVAGTVGAVVDPTFTTTTITAT